jgi:CBS domain containing-hemolysin-like protein
MDGSITLLTSLGALLFMSAFFSATETAFTSFNSVRMKNTASNGDAKAALVLRLAENFDRVLTTLLIGNNIVNISMASIGVLIFTRSFGDIGVTISTAVITILVLVFGEILPKTFAKESPERFAMFAAPTVRVLTVIFAPLNGFFAWGKDRITSTFNVAAEEKGITEEELLTIVEEAQIDGGINEEEGDLIRSVIEFDDLEVVDIVTPRVDVVAASESASTEEILAIFRDTGYSRLPIYRESVDNIIGVIHQKDFHNEVAYAKMPLETIIKPAIFVTESMKISTLMRQLQQHKSHIAIVTDEFGGTLGIVTMEDIIEELVGEIWDEHDEVVEEIEQVAEGKYKVMAGANLDKIFRLLDIDDEETGATTVGGWVTEQLGRVPEEGDHFIYENVSTTITKTNSRRVLEVLFKIIAVEEAQEVG